MEPRKRLNHETPFWVPENFDYFITANAEVRGQNHFCKADIGAEILNSVRYYNETELWFCSLVLLMPDHIHMIICFPRDASIARVMGNWKAGLTRKLGITWQRNFFDHRLRNEEEGRNKSEYILQNPVREGFVEDWQKWPYYWMPDAY